MSTLSVREARESVATAKSCLITCRMCGKMGVVTFVYGATFAQKQAGVRLAADEHRRIGCTVGESEGRFEYSVTYPRA